MTCGARRRLGGRDITGLTTARRGSRVEVLWRRIAAAVNVDPI
jgi:hypothetical protein